MSDNRINAALRSAGLALTAALDFADLIAAAFERLAPIVGNVGSDAKTSTAFTPTLLRGGVAVTALAAAVGEYSIIGKRCFISGYMTLTTKGGAAGDVITIGGLPVAAKVKANQNSLINIAHDGLDLAAGWVKGYIASGGSTINLQINTFGAPTGNANLTQAILHDGATGIFFEGSYPID